MRSFAAAVLIVAVVAVAAVHGHAGAQGPNRAGIVVSFGEGRIESGCIEFDEAEISGEELLRRAGLAVVASSDWGGGATCMIDDVGCADPSDCWCQCHGSTCRYWAYFTLEDGDWRYSPIGARQRKVHDGDVDGWSWGAGSVGSGAKPAPVAFEELCPPPAPPPPPPEVTPPPPATTMPKVEPTKTVVGAATATPQPAVATATVPAQTPSPTKTTSKATGSPIGHLPTEVDKALKEDSGSGLPWQLPVFGVLAVGLLGTAVALARKRSRG
jgi:hypothetical protein